MGVSERCVEREMGIQLTMITGLKRTRSVVGNTVVRKTANNYSERMSRAWHTHGNSTTIENGEMDPSGGERLKVFCRGCLGAVDGGDVWLDNITLSLLHETAHACSRRPLRHSSP